jgi:hypothetical protein
MLLLLVVALVLTLMVVVVVQEAIAQMSSVSFLVTVLLLSPNSLHLEHRTTQLQSELVGL